MTLNKNYIGLACTCHDSAIAIVNAEGQVVFAEGAERSLQYKRALFVSPDVPLRTSQLIEKYCDPKAALVAAFSWTRQHASYMERLIRGLSRPDTAGAKARAQGGGDVVSRRTESIVSYMANAQCKALALPGYSLNYEFQRLRGWQGAPIEQRFFDHHLTHAATACYSSGFDEGLCAIVDGYGEHGAAATYHYEQGKLTQLGARDSDQSSLSSLGWFYSELCEFCGFDFRAGEEWKLMGLAAYGESDPQIYELLKCMIGVSGTALTTPAPAEMALLNARLQTFARSPGQPALEVANLAHTAQKVFAETLYAYLSNLHAAGRSDQLIYGGGCALNSSANGGVLRNTPFKRLHVYAAPADDGNAVGAALLAYQQDNPGYRPERQLMSPYLGSEMSAETLEKVRQYGQLASLRECREAPAVAAELLSRGAIVGWIQGRAEFGPRALGNRSILADPRRSDVKDRLNACVKFREEFRPFAPAILHEHGPEYFHDYQESPYMERTLRFRNEVVGKVAGAVHVDGTGRLQTVRKEWNPRYYSLLSSFYDLTGIPLIINTSYNVMGKPLAHSVEDVLSVFFTSGIDAVFIGDVMIQKPM
jgi:carbamoyltransferase